MNIKFFSIVFSLVFITCSILCEKTTTSTYDLLGYESNISHIYSADETTKIPVIGVLGVGDPSLMYKGKFDTDQTFTVTFSFSDTILRGFSLNPITIVKALRSINIGQEIDATALLHTIIECFKKGHKKVHIFANSRGGGATIAALEILSNPEAYQCIWKKLGVINSEVQNEIRDMVARGVIFLAHPLLDHTKSLMFSKSKLYSSVGFFQKGCYWLTRALLYCFTQFNYNYPTHISMIIKNLNSEKWPYSVIVSLAQHDEITGNDNDEKLAYLARIYPEKLTIISGGSHHRDIRASMQLCRQKIFTNNSFTV